MNTLRFLDEITHTYDYRGQAVHVHEVPARQAQFGDLSEPLHPDIAVGLSRMGIERLYVHQVAALEAARRREHVVIVTGTASGKTLCYSLPTLEQILDEPSATALYLFPTKALAQDQLRGLLRFAENVPHLALTAGTYDGDTPRDLRRTLRDKGNVILTNPDMLHGAILPHHTGWARFLERLRFIVIDEIHSYRGIFGSHLANVLRRLKRVCSHYGGKPQFICCSATIANPVELVERLTGEQVAVVDQDGSPRGKKYFILWNPPRLDTGGDRKSANSEAKELMVRLLQKRVQTIAFTRARVVAELLYRYVREDLQRLSPSLANAVRAYRGGYLPQDRREIERMLFSGELLGVTSTNALELGIDIGGLDACLIVGFPGSVAGTWQQAGRAGRGSSESVVFLIGHNSPIDQYLMNHPRYFFDQPSEHAVIDPNNPHIVLGHLRAAAFELPIRVREEREFGEFAPALIEILAEDRQLALMGSRWHWTGRGYPADDVNLRNIAENTYTIIDETEGTRVIGSTDESSAFFQLHPEAVYIHEGESYAVRELDLDQKVARVKRAELDYYTQAISDRRVLIVQPQVEKEWNGNQVGFGDVEVTFIVFMFKKIKFYTRDSIGFGKVQLPPSALETCGFWLSPSLDALRRVREAGRNPVEGLLGIGNVATDVLPLYALCDPADIGSAVDSSNTGIPTLFIFDRYPGGIGFAQRAYELVEPIFRGCLELIHECSCPDGCPSCVGAPLPPQAQLDPDTDVRGRIADREAALMLLHDMLGLEPYTPKPRSTGPLAWSQVAAATDPDDNPDESTGPSRPAAAPLPDQVELRIRKQLQRLGPRPGRPANR